jgi:hypothetical protein
MKKEGYRHFPQSWLIVGNIVGNIVGLGIQKYC